MRKIRSPQITGLECASPATGMRQTTFSPPGTSHATGVEYPSARPRARGPRKDGQLPSWAAMGATQSGTAQTDMTSFSASGAQELRFIW